MVPLEWVRQFDAKCVSENGNDDPVEKQQNRSDNADAHDNADDQGERNTNDCKGILVAPSRHYAAVRARPPGQTFFENAAAERANSPPHAPSARR